MSYVFFLNAWNKFSVLRKNIAAQHWASAMRNYLSCMNRRPARRRRSNQSPLDDAALLMRSGWI
jgi:hypothetical protein